MKIIAITQARYGSTRLPGKVMKVVNGKTLLQLHLERASRSRKIDEFIVATTIEIEADGIVELAAGLGYKAFRGSIEDVLDRYYQAAKKESPDYVVRITSDCPLIDAQLIDEVIERCVEGDYDYCANTLAPTYPDGMDVEVMKFSALETAWKGAELISEREHVTPYIRKHSSFCEGLLFKSCSITGAIDYSKFRLTVDEDSDFVLITKLIEEVGDDKNWLNYVEYLNEHPELFEINSFISRNQGFMKSMQEDKIRLRRITNFRKSDEHRNKIHDLIPGGAHTYSKGDDQFPRRSPAAIAYGKGAYLWDIDDNKFLDCSMGLTSVSLGHAYEPVIDRIKEELQKGVNFQRPSYLEREMAENFLSLVPQHQMIKFAKNGSTVTTAAVKLARAYTGRKLVAFPVEHPFYSYDDWFIGTTQCNLGVPEEIGALSVTYKADDLNSLKELFERYPNQIACVISEPEKNWGIPENYLKDTINLIHQYGAIFIQDEMITGFKTGFPGSIKKYNVDPDLATWGKGIANGFSFCALTGKKEIMELGGIRKKGSEKVFLISTTHGGETSAMAAGLATIHEFQSKKVIEYNHSIGDYFNRQCLEVIERHKLTDYIQMVLCNWMPLFIFKDIYQQACPGLRTLAMQEMIQRGVLFQGAFVPCFSHTRDDIDYFAAAFDESLGIYAKAMSEGYEHYLEGDITKPVFRRYL
jgi:glutamate-1-semialdehyde aminotransferase/spore coat polysaccharide biosynthesis protein SpsF (cytidylyltransferase family)